MPLPLPQKKNQKKIDNKVTLPDYPVPSAPTTSPIDASSQIPVSTVSNFPYSMRNHNQYFKIAPYTKTLFFLTDAPNTDDPDASDNDSAGYPNTNYNYYGFTTSKKSQCSLRKRNQYFKNSHNTKKTFKLSLMPPMMMTKLLLTIMLMMPSILMKMMMYPKTPKHPHIN